MVEKTLVTSGYFTNPARINSEAKQAQDDIRDYLSNILGGFNGSVLTISSGTATPGNKETGSVFIIDTEAAATTDDLDFIDTTNLREGALYLLRSSDNARSVVIKHNQTGTGKFLLNNSADFTLNNINKFILFRLEGTKTQFQEVFRSFGSDIDSFHSYLKITPERSIQLLVTDDYVSDLTTGDGICYFVVPAQLDGYFLSRAHLRYITAGSGTLNSLVQIHNVNTALDVLSTRITIGPTGTEGLGTINSSNAGVLTNHLLRIDVDQVPETTAPKGAILTLTFDRT